MFRTTPHCGTVALLSHKAPDSTVDITVEFGEGEGKVPSGNIDKRAETYKLKEKVTHGMIQEYVEAKYGLKVHTAYIADDILDAVVYDNIFCSVALILHREKKGLDADNSSESFQKLVMHDYDSNISKAVCNRAIMWLQSAGILDFAGKVSECRMMDFKGRCRCFFTDVGLTYYFLRKIGADLAGVQGMLHENFVFLELRRRVERLKEIALETPAFATYKGGEIDFYVKSLEGNEKTYAVGVKSGKQTAPTGQLALDDGKVDYLLLLKGNTKGGRVGQVVTVPVFLFPKFRFDF